MEKDSDSDADSDEYDIHPIIYTILEPPSNYARLYMPPIELRILFFTCLLYYAFLAYAIMI